jgi:serine phosphatase RsbU (regulator of sigma subunit)
MLLLVVLGAAGFAAYMGLGLLFDASVPGTAIALFFAAMLAQTLAESNAQREALRERLHRERETAARLAGELDAARRIQVGILPRPEKVFPAERRFEISASMEPAREVGGDLYDFFMLDADRLFFLVGDVSGKGLPASIFMAVSKALCKSTALRRGRKIDQFLREANAEIARENPESLFVTVFAGVLDTRSGLLEYCNAGHEPPFVLASDGEVTRLDGGRGPPLCVLDGFSYSAAEHAMTRQEILLVISDGVTEAMNPEGALYGARRLLQAIEGARPADRPSTFVGAVRADVAKFVAGSEATDDMTLLAMRWNGAAV